MPSVTHTNSLNFCRYLISKVTDSKIFLNYPVRTIAHLYECYSGLGFEDKILEMGKDYIIELSYELDYSDSRKLLMKCREHFSKEEFVVLCQKGDFSTSDIFDLDSSINKESAVGKLNFTIFPPCNTFSNV